MAVQGRWTIGGGYDGARHAVFVFDGPQIPPCQHLPVVPCDDAAVERSMNALRAWYPSYFAGRDHKAREVAEAVLRAAGETS